MNKFIDTILSMVVLGAFGYLCFETHATRSSEVSKLKSDLIDLTRQVDAAKMDIFELTKERDAAIAPKPIPQQYFYEWPAATNVFYTNYLRW